ncbi:hypothetical protein KUG47_11835, partial [Falsochrobactrum sp. TDYN1]
MASPYSQASSNFSDSMSGGVDPRTGLYSASLLLAHLKANGTSGPFLPLSLKYDPMSSIDMGFGVGWGLSWSHYSTDDGVLSLSTGDRYSTTMQSGNLALKDQKIVSAKLRQTDGVYHVQNRKGDTHILGRYVSGNLWVPSRILAPNGLGVTLIWNNDGRLKSIVDELAEDGDTPQTLVEIDYSNALKTTVTLWPGTDTQKVITVILPGGTNSAIYFGGLAWIMHYDDSIRSFGKPPLCRIEYPSGAIETVTYTSDEDGHRYPLCAPQAASQTIPYVSEYRKKIVGNDTDRVINYSFSAKNFVGYQSGISEWKANGDNLYEADKNYTYQSFETRYDGNNNKIKTTNEYNKFHLLTRTMRGGSVCLNSFGRFA